MSEQTTEKAKPKNFLREHEAQQMRDDLAGCERMLKRERVDSIDRKTTAKRMRRMEHQLETLALKPVPSHERDALAAEVKELEGKFVPSMPSKDEMYRNPPGAVGKHERWLRRHKQEVLDWKRKVSRLELGSDDPDIANVERLRPGSGYGDIVMDHTAQINRKSLFSAPSEQFMANYDGIDFEKKIESMVAEGVTRELEKLAAGAGSKANKKS